MSIEPADVVGWTASAILVATVSRQVWTQWQQRSTAGLSHWLFIGQFAASAGFLFYSWMLDNAIFVASNALLLVAAMVGQACYVRNRRHEAAAPRYSSEPP